MISKLLLPLSALVMALAAPALADDSPALGSAHVVSRTGASQISVLAPDGAEVARYSGPTDSGVPIDGPANIAFDDAKRSIVFTNHASTSRNPDHFALIEMFVDDRGDPLEKPEVR